MEKGLISARLPEYALEYALLLNSILRDDFHRRAGEYVSERGLASELPAPDASVLGASCGVIFSKRFHRFWFFKDGELVRQGVASFANYKAGYSTPVGLFKLFRKEGPNYFSRENPDPQGRINMSYAIFLHALNFLGLPRGVAIHAGVNICKRGNETLYLLDSSKGCIHLNLEDAKFFNNNLCALKSDGRSDRVLILPTKLF